MQMFGPPERKLTILTPLLQMQTLFGTLAPPPQASHTPVSRCREDVDGRAGQSEGAKAGRGTCGASELTSAERETEVIIILS